MRVICAWCQCVIAEGDGGDGDTHGICPACLREFLQRAGIKRERIDGDVEMDEPLDNSGNRI